MSGDWRNWDSGRTGLSVARLGDGETVRVHVIEEPFRRDTSESENALHVPVKVMEAPDDFSDMSGEAVETGEDGREYNIINSSSGFFNALIEAFPADSPIAGQMAEITAHQPGEEAYSRFYNIEAI